MTMISRVSFAAPSGLCCLSPQFRGPSPSRRSVVYVHGLKNDHPDGSFPSRGGSKSFDRTESALRKIGSFAENAKNFLNSAKEGTVLGLTALSLSILLSAQPANAADAIKTCLCLLRECKTEFVECLEDPKCAANIACLNTCNGRPDETECQIACGDLFENSVVDNFNRCAVSEKKCVPQRKDEGLFPIPPDSAIVPEFNTSQFDGPWYISSGLNPSFDIFDCQLHEFSSEPGRMVVQLTWRIQTPDGGFFTRSGEQRFIQDSQKQGILYNHDNEILHYQDDWYILSAKTNGESDDYILVYYRGVNDAWDGYGGAVLYTRSRTVPPTIVPQVSAALQNIGLDFAKFTATDNSCPPPAPLLARLEKKIESSLEKGEKELERIGKSILTIGETEIKLFGQLGKVAEEVVKDKDIFFKEIGEEEQMLLGKMKMDAEDVEDLFGNPIPIRKRRFAMD